MNAQQQYQKLVSMRAHAAQLNREDNAMRELQRMSGEGAGVAALGEMTGRQRRDLEMSDVLLQSRPFTPDLQGGFVTSGAERAMARTKARRTEGQRAPPAAPRVVPRAPRAAAAPRAGGFG